MLQKMLKSRGRISSLSDIIPVKDSTDSHIETYQDGVKSIKELSENSTDKVSEYKKIKIIDDEEGEFDIYDGFKQE